MWCQQTGFAALPFSDLKNSSDLTTGCKPQQTDEMRKLVKKRRQRKRGRLHGERRVRRENCQSLQSYTSHQCLCLLDTPYHAAHGAPSNSTRSPTSPGSAPHSGVCAAKEGAARISTLHVALLKNWGLASASGAGTPRKGEIVSTQTPPQSLYLWGLSVCTWNDCHCFKLELGKLMMERRETSRNI